MNASGTIKDKTKAIKKTKESCVLLMLSKFVYLLDFLLM